MNDTPQKETPLSPDISREPVAAPQEPLPTEEAQPQWISFDTPAPPRQEAEETDMAALEETPAPILSDDPEQHAESISPEEASPVPEDDVNDVSVDLSDFDFSLPEMPMVDAPEDAPSPAPEDVLSFLDDAAYQEEPEIPEEPLTEDDQDFQELFQAEAPAEEKEIPQHPHPAKKGRPRNKTGEGFMGIPNILVTIVWIAITLAIGLTLGRMAWVCAADVLAFGREDKQVTVTISSSDTIDDIAEKLQTAGLIRYKELFKLYASFAVDDGEIQAGIWDLNTLYDYHALVNMMSPSSQRSVVTIMIPEGSSCRQVFELLQEKRVCTIESLESYAATGELGEYWFLENLERGDKYCLEGYLFPDTYEFYTNDNPENVLGKMLKNFDNRVNEDVRGKLTALNETISAMMRKDGRNQEYIDSHQFTMADIITVASLIEKETASAQEGYTVSSVIYNRLFAWNGTPAYLNIDAAVIYGLDGKSDLTAEDLQTDTPYNTYLHTGLTPGPITNPGLNSILAALEPENTSYYYYVLDPTTGVHHFSKTLDEHEAFRAALRG